MLSAGYWQVGRACTLLGSRKSPKRENCSMRRVATAKRSEGVHALLAGFLIVEHQFFTNYFLRRTAEQLAALAF